MRNSDELDLNNINKELQLQLEIIRREGISELKAMDNDLFENINWDNFLALAIHHRIYAYIYPKLKLLSSECVPAHITQTLQKYFKMNTFQMLYLGGEIERISKMFHENSIRLLFLKGPVLAVDLYKDISFRTSSDIDLIVPLNDLEKVGQLLVDDGYVKDDYFSTVLNDWKWRHHHMTYFHPEKSIKLEVHWRLNPGPSKEPTFDELWENRRISSLTNFPVYGLGREDLFLSLISHGARHGWSRLRWLIDIQKILEQPLDWRRLNRLLKRYQLLHIGGQAVILTSQLLKTTQVEEMKLLLEGSRSKKLAQEALFYIENMVELHADTIPEDVAKYHKKHLFSLMTNRQKILFITSFLYPYPEDVALIPLPKKLYFLYFPLRPILWAWRKKGNRLLQ
ncbi:Renal dipeptidase [Bacillus cereus]|uniref:nucleotidyltransferase domain-containing protein n=1 Tax=Bacillus nitratireducens TaxID=2026193 RepID=UPI000BECE54E|nr:nucleotidyltransferase family protein [Bacillus nitratireducens]PEA20185.1 Renal dipeptidase [Bacillus cereus]PFB98610.1 Renal dipeptidase [Bacillus cereus]